MMTFLGAGAEKAVIDAWIQREGLNRFGDAAGTMYPGGSPLFDEVTGIRMDRCKLFVLC
jgi:hypothetical protein